MRGSSWRRWAAAAVVGGLAAFGAQAAGGASGDPPGGPPAAADPPAGFQRFFPKGHIPGLDKPTYVPAAEARIPPDNWVVGVVVEGQAFAYEIDLLTRSEVVNDAAGGTPFAVVWCPLANSLGVFDRRVDGRELHFEPSGVLMHGAIVMQDRETESFWPLLHERSVYGPLLGKPLARIPGATKARWADWVRDHPKTLAWSLDGRQSLGGNPMVRYQASSLGYRGLDTEDRRLATKETVFGFLREGKAYAAAAPDLEDGRAFAVGAEWVFLHRPRGSNLDEPTSAYHSKAGFAREGEIWVERGSGARFDAVHGRFTGDRTPERLEGFDVFWYVWSLNYPRTVLLGRP